MPTSDTGNITLIIQIVRDHYNVEKKPGYSILSIGPGCGKFELMFREYLDGCWYGRAFHDKSTWETKITVIEAFEPYLNPDNVSILSTICDRIILCDVRNYHDEPYGADDDKYDLIWMGDVIEHMPLDEGVELLERFRHNLNPNGIILISTPNYDCVINEPVYGNEYEVHKSRWFPEDFENLKGFSAKIIPGRAWTVKLTALEGV